MVILGIDPGIALTGYGLIRVRKRASAPQYITCGVFPTPKDKGIGERLWLLEKQLKRLLTEHKPDVVAVESLFFFKNLKTVMPVSEAKGVIMLTVAKKRLPVLEFSPPQVKMTVCGYGRADKKQVQRMVQEILQLKDLPRPDDAADALALALTYSFVAGKKGIGLGG